MSRPVSSRDIAESGLFVAATLTLVLLGVTFLRPLLYLLPTPLAVVTRRRGWVWGALAAIGVTLLSVFLVGADAGGVLVLASAGLVIGGISRYPWQAVPVVMVGSVVLALGLVALLAAWAGVAGQSLTSWYDQLLAALHRGIVELYHQTLTGVQQEQAIAQAEALLAPLRLLWPAALLISSGGIALVNYGLLRLLLHRLGDEIPAGPSFSRWHLPWPFLWGLIAGLAAMYLAEPLSGQLGASGRTVLQAIGLNLEAIFSLVFGVQGVALVWFWLERTGVTPVWRWLVVVLAFLWPLMWMALVLAGALDSWFDWRKLEHHEEVR
ncbi:MAG: DUF2232 domain-containing protein [Limnochordaceae bacterium]|nr:DUF2232 domain-containing protein [Limnochordaceae bacterium]